LTDTIKVGGIITTINLLDNSNSHYAGIASWFLSGILAKPEFRNEGEGRYRSPPPCDPSSGGVFLRKIYLLIFLSFYFSRLIVQWELLS
jgi:hypothetical protein